MLSNIEALFYTDIDLHDWESMLATLSGESESVVTERAKAATWEEIRSNDDYENIESVSNIYASKLLDAVVAIINNEYPNLSHEQYINCLNTSFSVDGQNIHDFDDLQNVLATLTGLEMCVDILDELNDSEFNDLDDAERDSIQKTGVVGDMRAATNLASFIDNIEATDEEVAGIYHFSECPQQLRKAIGAALQIKRFIDDNTKFCDTEVTVVDSTVCISCDIRTEGYFEIESITDLWQVLEMSKPYA